MKKKTLSKAVRSQFQTWAAVIGCAFIMVGVSFAWYTREDKTADSKVADVMVPYYLELQNPSETASMQLSIGNLPLGGKKQIVFCVTNKNPDTAIKNKNVSRFNYTLELVHTDNMSLDYSIYELVSVQNADSETITITDTFENGNGQNATTTTYWKKEGTDELSGEDVSVARHKELKMDSDENYANIINKGTYTEFDGDGTSKFELISDTQPSQYYLLEIEWTDEGHQNFEKYEKETDMVYMLAKALQPEPEKKQ